MLFTFLFAAMAFGHGEDKPGPHGGYIRMPGAFHTEVVPLGEGKLRVFLLDINFQDPVVAKSSVSLSFEGGKAAAKAKCKKRESAFECEFPKGVSLKEAGKLRLSATRSGQKGMEVEYPTPLAGERAHKGH